MVQENSQNIAVRVHDAIKIYKRGSIEVVALRGLSCEFLKGEITVIMGPSGCGKTTLLNMIGGLDRLSSGKIWVNEQEITNLTNPQLESYRREKVGFVFQFMNLLPELNATENITLPLEFSGKLTPEKKIYVAQLLETVGLKERQTHRPDQLSGGEQQRIGVAAALANNPELILCDEPTGELDSESKLVIMDLLRKLITQFPQKAMIIVSHDPDMRAIADRLYYIKDGRISFQYNKEDLQKMKESTNTAETNGLPTDKSTSDRRIKEQVLMELREIDQMVKEKMNRIEKDLHPI